METAEITKTKPPTFKQVVKAVKAYAAKHGQKFVQVEEHYNCDSSGGNEKQSFRAYINNFGTFAIGDNIPDIIKQFQAVSEGVKPQPADPLDFIDLPF